MDWIAIIRSRYDQTLKVAPQALNTWGATFEGGKPSGMLEKQSCWAHKIMLAFHWRLKKWAEIEKVRQGPGMNHKLIT